MTFGTIAAITFSLIVTINSEEYVIDHNLAGMDCITQAIGIAPRLAPGATVHCEAE